MFTLFPKILDKECVIVEDVDLSGKNTVVINFLIALFILRLISKPRIAPLSGVYGFNKFEI